jgi:glycosyltransferase involved in cell wall biosynthesis
VTGATSMSTQRSGSEPLFSVVIPTYGRAELLREAVGSVLAQTVDDLECLVVDDASPEPVAVPDHPRIRALRHARNGGPAAARNTGLAAARGRYVAFLDDDDVWTPGRLELALRALERADIGICHRASMDSRVSSGEALEGSVHNVICDSITPHLGQTAVRRDRCLHFDERFVGCQDVDWWIRSSRGLRVSTEAGLGLLVRTHPGTRHRNGVPARVEGSRLLLQLHQEYFDQHPRARAFRELRIGLMTMELGERAEAVGAFTRSLRSDPQLRTVWHLGRVLAGQAGRASRNRAVSS